LFVAIYLLLWYISHIFLIYPKVMNVLSLVNDKGEPCATTTKLSKPAAAATEQSTRVLQSADLAVPAWTESGTSTSAYALAGLGPETFQITPDCAWLSLAGLHSHLLYCHRCERFERISAYSNNDEPAGHSNRYTNARYKSPGADTNRYTCRLSDRHTNANRHTKPYSNRYSNPETSYTANSDTQATTNAYSTPYRCEWQSLGL